MTDPEVARRYDELVGRYVEANRDALDRVPGDRDHVDAFAADVRRSSALALDVGCGPGHVTARLAEHGVRVVGLDRSRRMIDHAVGAHPGVPFVVADLAHLPAAPGSIGGILARYSLIHVAPAAIPVILLGWRDVLESGGRVLLAFFAADEPGGHGEPFDHRVAPAHRLDPDVVSAQLDGAGFEVVAVHRRPPLPGERPVGHATITARRRTGGMRSDGG